MARMIPYLNQDQLRALPSKAEARFYEACRDQLPEDTVVIYSVTWLYRDDRGYINEGEADFTVLRPNLGVIAVEVKGGGIRFDPATGAWTSRDRAGAVNSIKDPFRQASKERHALIDQITGHANWHQFKGGSPTFGHAVMFPDIDDARPLVGPNRELEILGVNSNMARLTQWIDQVGQYWRRRVDAPLNARGVRVIEDILCTPIDVRPVLRAAVDEVEEQRIRLTANQAKVLRIIGGRRRAAVAGGAGTGKTLIAVEKATQLAHKGLSVLLLCYNKPLAEFLATALQDEPQVRVHSFHQLCYQRIRQARAFGRELEQEAVAAFPGQGERHRFDIVLPFALALSVDVLDEKFDAIVVDEGQDFSEEYWFGIEALLHDSNQAHVFVFIDANQSIYPRQAGMPIEGEPFNLTVNCRNTIPIHEAAYRFYKGELTDPPELQGPAIVWTSGIGVEEQAEAIANQVQRWVTVDRLEPKDIVVLIAKGPKEHCHQLLRRREAQSGVRWAIESHAFQRETTLVDTVARFKGLEAHAVVLWVGDEIIDDERWETLYVGATRAKSLLVVVSSERVQRAVRSHVPG